MRRLFVVIVLIAAAGAGLAAPAARDVVLYNHSPSVPVGLYVRVGGGIERGALVTVRARDVAPAAARARGFDDASDRFIKRVAAIAGDHVCAEDDRLHISGGVEVVRRSVDSAGRAIARWRGCRVLGAHEVLLLGDTEDSFDGRYWGPVERDLIEGVWRPFNVERARGD